VSTSFADTHENLLPHHGEVYYERSFFSKEESDLFFRELLVQVEWKQMPIKIYGKEVMQPRLTAWFADEGVQYTYSGLTLGPVKWHPAILNIKQRVEGSSGFRFNSALLNLYRDGNDSMGWHRDNEKELGNDPPVASVNFGATRKFLIRDYHKKENTISLDLEHGSFLLMCEETQHYWQHSVPKTSKASGTRINITFRNIL
jgi:alkylated DNA repair dioxygenase AlkB